ncbi:hypothetical protein MPSEU_000866000 [Mayamaea pseudoterrestris]|nr:hypothetical protein MPSEU_000866000 [Mayamaea pseudoterrestris]
MSKQQCTDLSETSASSSSIGSSPWKESTRQADGRGRNDLTPFGRFCDLARDKASYFSSRMMSTNPCNCFGGNEQSVTLLGISPMMAPGDEELANAKSASDTAETPRLRRIQRHRQKQRQAELLFGGDWENHDDIEVHFDGKVQVQVQSPIAVRTSVVRSNTPAMPHSMEVSCDMLELERNISELTLPSSHVSTGSKTMPDHRRMAFYAVGAKQPKGGPGDSRGCYFSGKPIFAGTPFYAGCLRQNMRTMVVFCLPSALGLPAKTSTCSSNSIGSTVGVASDNIDVCDAIYKYKTKKKKTSRRYWSGSSSTASTSQMSTSPLTSYDDLSSKSLDGGVDSSSPSGQELLRQLPLPDRHLLDQMQILYPNQFITLPLEIRDVRVWKLYMRFCFFSGLPIAENEVYYKLREDINFLVRGKQVLLSRDVMEAAHGNTATSLMHHQPNQQTFRYLEKNYSLQCSKLDESVFQRSSWERVAPSVYR